MKTFLYDRHNTQKLEVKLEKSGTPSLLLMMRAGLNLYQIVKSKIDYDEIIVLAGPGNNGGDAGDVDNDLGVIAKSGADGVILVGDKIPIEAALVSSRNYKEEMIIFAETENLDCNNSVKLLALGASGIFLQNKCSGSELKEFGSNLSRTVGSLGVGNASDLSLEHLQTTSQEVASMTGISIAGYNSVLPMWRH